MIYGSLIAAATEANDVCLAKKLLEKFNTVKMENPNRKCTQLIDLFSGNNDLESALRTFRSNKPTKFELSAIMTACLRCNQPLSIWNEFKKSIIPGISH